MNEIATKLKQRLQQVRYARLDDDRIEVLADLCGEDVLAHCDEYLAIEEKRQNSEGDLDQATQVKRARHGVQIKLAVNALRPAVTDVCMQAVGGRAVRPATILRAARTYPEFFSWYSTVRQGEDDKDKQQALSAIAEALKAAAASIRHDLVTAGHAVSPAQLKRRDKTAGPASTLDRAAQEQPASPPAEQAAVPSGHSDREGGEPAAASGQPGQPAAKKIVSENVRLFAKSAAFVFAPGKAPDGETHVINVEAALTTGVRDGSGNIIFDWDRKKNLMLSQAEIMGVYAVLCGYAGVYQTTARGAGKRFTVRRQDDGFQMVLEEARKVPASIPVSQMNAAPVVVALARQIIRQHAPTVASLDQVDALVKRMVRDPTVAAASGPGDARPVRSERVEA